MLLQEQRVEEKSGKPKAKYVGVTINSFISPPSPCQVLYLEPTPSLTFALANRKNSLPMKSAVSLALASDV